jgi:hypothetical protein
MTLVWAMHDANLQNIKSGMFIIITHFNLFLSIHYIFFSFLFTLEPFTLVQIYSYHCWAIL